MNNSLPSPTQKSPAIAKPKDDFLVKIPTVVIWPSGDMSLGYAPNPKDKAKDAEDQDIEGFYATDKEGMVNAIEDDLEAWGNFALALEAEGRTQQAFTAYESFASRVQSGSGLSDAINSHNYDLGVANPNGHKERAPRGTNGITPFGARSLRSIAAVLEKEYDRTLMTFSTCTVPSLPEDEMSLITDQWPEMTRRFQQELRREMKRCGLPLDYFGCSEVQPKRWEERQEIAPHLHFCFVGRTHRSKPWAINHQWVTQTWNRIIETTIGHPFDGRATCETRGVEKSIGHEVGKYLSKGGKIIAEIRKAGRGGELPSAYWNAPNALRREIKALTHRFRGRMAEVLHNQWKALNDLELTSLREVMVELPNGERGSPHSFRAGFTGWVKGDALAEIEDGDIWGLYLTASLLGG